MTAYWPHSDPIPATVWTFRQPAGTDQATPSCERGCKWARHHIKGTPTEPGCPCDDPNHDGSVLGHTCCRGCAPRPAKHGRLCWPCHRRLQLMLTDAPVVADWLHVHVLRTSTTQRIRQDYELAAGDGFPPIPLDVEIMAQQATVERAVIGWCGTLLQATNMTGPDRLTVSTASAFLLVHLSTIELHDWVVAMFADLAEVQSEAHALAPWRPAMRRMEGIPCPTCSECSLVIFGGEDDVTCLNRDCREMIPPGRYGIWVRMMTEEVSA